MDNGWVKIYRKIKEWQHYQEPRVLQVFLELVLSANSNPSWSHGKRVGRGEVIISVSDIMKSTGIKSNNTVIDALNKLEESGDIKREPFGNGTKITINQFSKYQGCANSEQPTAQPTAQHAAQHAAHKQEYIEEKEYKEKEEGKENLVVEGARAGKTNSVEFSEKEKDCAEKEKEDFSSIEDISTQNAQLIMMRTGWNAIDYANAVADFIMTCRTDGLTHDSESSLFNHFRNWVGRRYKHGERPLAPGNAMQLPMPKNQNDIAFDDFYRSKFNTSYVWQNGTSEEIQKLVDAIAAKISESGNAVIPSDMPNNITAFLSKAWSLEDAWLREHFTPKNIVNQFNVIYGYIRNGKKPSTGKQNNPFGVSEDYLAKIQRELLGGN